MKRGLEAVRQLLINDPMKVLLPLVIFAITFLLALLVRRVLLRALQAWSARTQSRGGSILHQALPGPLMIWALMLAGHFAIQSAEIPPHVAGVASAILLGLWIFSLTLLSMRVVGDLVRFYGGQVPGATPVTTLTQTLAQISVLILGGLVLLNHFNVSITPILTALGVGGLAVALALQDTLSNLFGGFYVAVARQVRLGDYIKLNTAEEGYVTDIGWRSTTIRALSNNMIIVPNSKLAQAIVTNYYLPEKRMSASFPVIIGYDSDLDQVERLLAELLTRSAGEIPGMLAEPAPNVTFDPGFTENGIGLTLNYQVAEFTNQFGVRNELRRRVYKIFQQEGVVSPYPTRTVYLRGGGRRKADGKGMEVVDARPPQ